MASMLVSRRQPRHPRQRDSLRLQGILEPHQPKSHRTMLQVGTTRFRDGVEIDVDDVVEHPHRVVTVRFNRVSSSSRSGYG